jgi:(p)ppGpp synthase/HD superfamily hydrolase
MQDILSWSSKFTPCFYSDRLINKLLLLNAIVSNPVDIQEVKKAIYYAVKYHGSQKRQSGEPYYSHPLEVAYMLSEHAVKGKTRYFRTDLIVTAILHDCLEDTELTFAMIKAIFGRTVASQVMDLTRIKGDGRKIGAAEMIELLWLQKKFDMLFIKQLDRIHNLQTINAKSEDKIKRIVNETFNTFIVSAMATGDKNIEKTIYELCCQILSIEMINHEFQQITSDYTHLVSLKDSDTHQYLSQVFQNVARPIENQK